MGLQNQGALGLETYFPSLQVENAMPSDALEKAKAAGSTNWAAVAALGIVYGDLGTSPLYTMQTVMGALGGKATPDAAVGILSLLIWTLLLTISLKYCVFVMRADNHGEGGIMALMSLVGANGWRRGVYLGASMGLLGAALIYGDGVITPAISVLSALEGVKVVAPGFSALVLPLAVVVLILLFAAQKFGTARIGGAFGPIMLVWFLVIGLMGLVGVIHHPMVLKALNPLYGLGLLRADLPIASALLGGVFLCATGGEALYADMGHFGPVPIRRAWYWVVLPCLLLSYAGQAGQLMDGAPKGVNPFFLAAPTWAVIPLVGLATVATIIASQAIITGSFSMTRQAMQLGWLPGFDIRQTSDKVYGQIYVPVVNALMAIGTIAIAISFGSSDKLAGAFGTAVSTTMVLTTLLLLAAMRRVWKWPLVVVAPLGALFLAVDLSFFAANLAKIMEGGWVPLTLGFSIFAVMITWRTGVQTVRARLSTLALSPEAFFADLDARKVARVPGTAVFLTRTSEAIPPFITEYARKMGALHDHVIALHIEFAEQPRFPDDQRAVAEDLGRGVWRITLNYGFIEIPDIVQDLDEVVQISDWFKGEEALYFGTRDTLICQSRSPIDKVRSGIFSFLYRNSSRASDRFILPSDRTLEFARHVNL